MTLRRLGLIVAIGLAAGTTAAAQRGPASPPTGLPPDTLSRACAPSLTTTDPGVTMRISGGQDSFVRRSYLPGDLVTVNAGTVQGLEVGQEFFVRRLMVSQQEPATPLTPALVRTTGWIRIYAVDDNQSLATIAHACESIDVGDYLEPFALPGDVPRSTERLPAERGNYGRVLMGQDRRRTFARGDYLIVDRGSDHGVAVGTQFVFYRDKLVSENFLFELGEAVAVDVKADSATLEVTVSLDAIMEGDYAAMRR